MKTIRGWMGRTTRRALWAILLGTLLVLVAGACTPGRDRGEAGKTTLAVGAAAAVTASAAQVPRPGGPLKVGVTLHPYYSWTRNVVGDGRDVEVRPILPGDVDAGSYQPRPEDIKKIGDLDAIVINGIGHDDFIEGMIKASGNDKILRIRPNDGTPLLRSLRGGAVNSHTFLSFTNAVQQTYAIARALSSLRPDLAPRFQANAAAYAARLRKIKASALERLAGVKVTRVVTVHDGYSYLCQELGVEVAGVVEPAHGLVPSAAELGDMVDLIKREKIEVVLSEQSFPEKLLDVLRSSTGVKVYIISHVASGEYTADKFEKEMERNADTLVTALRSASAEGAARRTGLPGGAPGR